MISRRVIAGTIGAAVVFGLLPASVAQAQDDLVCARSDTRIAKNTTGEQGTTLVGYCAEWVWRPNAGNHGGGNRPGENDPDGGKGASPSGDTCESLKAELEDAAALLDLYDKEIPAAQASVDEQVKAVIAAYEERADSLEVYRNSQSRTDSLRTIYEEINDIDPTVTHSPKAGVVITRRNTYHIDTSTASGVALQAAVNAEERDRLNNLAADDAWRAASDELGRRQLHLDELHDRRAALLQAVEGLQGALSRCK